MRVIFYPEKQDPPRAGALYLDSIALIPGNNEVPDEVTKHRAWAKLLKLGAVKVVKAIAPETEQPKQDGIRITDLAIDEAKPVIEAETNLILLREWMELDSRKGIKDLISRQIKTLEAA